MSEEKSAPLPVLQPGHRYTRAGACQLLGGGEQNELFPQIGRGIIGCFFDSRSNPGAPEEIGINGDANSTARCDLLSAQPGAIPFFKRLYEGWWRYVGSYEFESWTDEPTVIKDFEGRTKRNVARLIFFRAVPH